MRIKVTKEVKTMEPGIKVKVLDGGNGAMIAEGAIGETIRVTVGEAEKLHWPSYAGTTHDKTAVYIKATYCGQPIIFGLANNCHLELL